MIPTVDPHGRGTGHLGFRKPDVDRTTDVFAALADPTRRRLIERLAADGEATATQLAASLPISRQAVVKHLAALAAAELVGARKVGREQRFVVRVGPMTLADAWMRGVQESVKRRSERRS